MVTREEPLAHYHPIVVSPGLSSASGARNGNCTAVAAAAAAGTGMLVPGKLCLYLSLNALPSVGSAAETLSCLYHAGIRFFEASFAALLLL